MKKLFFKRGIALFIDNLVLGCIVEGINLILTAFFDLRLIDLRVVLAIMLYSFKDFVFKNTSIGKRMMGLEIYDDKWEKPSLAILWKRCFWLFFVGSYLGWKAVHIDGIYSVIFQAEYSRFKTRVVEKKVIMRLKPLAITKSGFDPEKMSKLYNEYLGI